MLVFRVTVHNGTTFERRTIRAESVMQAAFITGLEYGNLGKSGITLVNITET